MSIEPDLAGFQEAQDRLRTKLGRDVTFLIPQTPVWPPGTQLDPESGQPHDPTIEPVSGGDDDLVVKRAALVFRPIKTNVDDPIGDVVTGGLHPATNIVADIAAADYPDVADATGMVVNETEFRLTQWVQDDSSLRWLAFGEPR